MAWNVKVKVFKANWLLYPNPPPAPTPLPMPDGGGGGDNWRGYVSKLKNLEYFVNVLLFLFYSNSSPTFFLPENMEDMNCAPPPSFLQTKLEFYTSWTMGIWVNLDHIVCRWPLHFFMTGAFCNKPHSHFMLGKN